MTCGSNACKGKNYFCYLCGVKIKQAWHFSHFLGHPFGEKCKTLFPNEIKEGEEKEEW
jgi:hypothetical protein